MRFLDSSEIRLLADSIDPRFRTLVIFTAFTGVRAGEVGALRWERLDLARGTADIAEAYSEVHGRLELGPPKTYEHRTVPLPQFLCDLLSEHQQADRLGGLVFRSATGGPIRHSSFYRRYFKPAVVASGIDPGFRFHDLRHTAAALLIAEGAHPLAVKERLGHSSITVTMDRYGHLLPALEQQLTESLNGAWRDSAVSQPCHSGPLDLTR